MVRKRGGQAKGKKKGEWGCGEKERGDKLRETGRGNGYGVRKRKGGAS